MSWLAKSPRDLIAILKEQYGPNATRETLRRAFAEQMRSDEQWFDAMVEYAFSNGLNSWEALQERSGPRKSEQLQRMAAAKVQRTERVEVAARLAPQILLLNLETPNGKRLRYCSKEECESFGGFYTKLAKKVPHSKLVGQVFDEDGLQRLLKS